MKAVCLNLIALLVTAGSLHAEDCFYAPRPAAGTAGGGPAPQGDCGSVAGDVLKLKKNHFERLFFADNGLAWIIAGSKAFYVSASGKTARTPVFDNGPDYFAEGLARTIVNNKFGYMDETLKTVIPTRYDFAFPFSQGHALVCNRCRAVQAGGHSEISGGEWGVIDTAGSAVIPVTYKKETLLQLPAFKKLASGAAPCTR